MPDTIEKSGLPEPRRERKLPEWYVDTKGQRHYRLRGGRWNLQRIAEFLIDNPVWQTVDDIARVVYGTTGSRYRDNVRKHIPAQRRYMLNSLEQPIITQYGERGRIRRVKLYSKTGEEDRILLKVELERLRERKELTETRYENLLHIFSLPPNGHSTD